MPFGIIEDEAQFLLKTASEAKQLTESMNGAADQINAVKPLTIGLALTAVAEVVIVAVSSESGESHLVVQALLGAIPLGIGISWSLHNFSLKSGFRRTATDFQSIRVSNLKKARSLLPLKHRGGPHDQTPFN